MGTVNRDEPREEKASRARVPGYSVNADIGKPPAPSLKPART